MKTTELELHIHSICKKNNISIQFYTGNGRAWRKNRLIKQIIQHGKWQELLHPSTSTIEFSNTHSKRRFL